MHSIASVLAGLALLVTAMVPPGYMAAHADDGSITIRICGGASGNTLAVSPDDPLFETLSLIGQKSGQDDGDGSDDEPCDIGTISFLGTTIPKLAPVRLPNTMVRQIARPALTGIFPSGLPPATGPPFF